MRYILLCVLSFFSSRRRHTRSKRDWSSDVCSSDLYLFTFLMATGYEQVRSITAYLAGDIEASKRVELDLPETGVCSVNLQKIGRASCRERVYISAVTVYVKTTEEETMDVIIQTSTE